MLKHFFKTGKNLPNASNFCFDGNFASITFIFSNVRDFPNFGNLLSKHFCPRASLSGLDKVDVAKTDIKPMNLKYK